MSALPITSSQAEPKPPAEPRIGYVEPRTGAPLRRNGDELLPVAGGDPAATIRGRVTDFIGGPTYVESFTYQWQTTDAVRTQDPTLTERHREEMNARTGFCRMDLRGMTCLEVGAGLGDDTAYLLEQGLGEIHAVDLSGSIFRAAELVPDERVRYARADVNALPFRPESFDLVCCHRMMQHTPHPAATLARAARMVKPGGLLFAHSYHRSKYFMRQSKYKYRWLTMRLPSPVLWGALTLTGPALRAATVGLGKVKLGGAFDGEEFARRWSPWALQGAHNIAGLDRRTLVRYEQQITFDALTPTYDLPMHADDFQDLIEALGFEILSIERRPWYPLWATARRVRSST